MQEQEISSEGEYFNNKAKNALSTGFIVSYLDSPSRASVMDWNTYQFVLLKTRYGAVDSFLVGVTKSILEKIETVTEEMKPNIGKQQFRLMLRGVWFDDAHASIEIYLELLHSDKILSLDTNEITEKFSSTYDSQTAIAKLTTTSASMESDWFSSLSDGYYVEIKKALFWVM